MTAMMINCPLCQGALQIDATLAGQQVHCPLCQGLLQLPSWEALSGVIPPPPAPPYSPYGPPPIEPPMVGPPVVAPPPAFGPPPMFQQAPAIGPPPALGPPPVESAPMSIPTGIPVGTPAPFPPSSLPTHLPTGSIPSGTSVAPQQPAPTTRTALAMNCPACKSPFEIRPEFAEKTVRCPTCAREMALPKTEQLNALLSPVSVGKIRMATVVEMSRPSSQQPASPRLPVPLSSTATTKKSSPPTSSPSGIGRWKTEPIPGKPGGLPAKAGSGAPSPPMVEAAPNLPPVDLPVETSTDKARPLPTSVTVELPPDAEPLLQETVPAKPAKKVDKLLPPGAVAEISEPQPAPANPIATSPQNILTTKADVLLPPGAAAGVVVQPGAEQAIPKMDVGENVAAPLMSTMPVPKVAPGTIVLPTADGKFKTVRDAPKAIQHGGDEIELRRLTDEEKTRRRVIRNLVLVLVSLAIIGITFYVMMPRQGRPRE